MAGRNCSSVFGRKELGHWRALKKYLWCSELFPSPRSQLWVGPALLTWILAVRTSCDAKTSRVPTQSKTHPMPCQANGDILMCATRKILLLTLRRMGPCYQKPCPQDSLSCRDREQFLPAWSKMKRMLQAVGLTVSVNPSSIPQQGYFATYSYRSMVGGSGYACIGCWEIWEVQKWLWTFQTDNLILSKWF